MKNNTAKRMTAAKRVMVLLLALLMLPLGQAAAGAAGAAADAPISAALRETAPGVYQLLTDGPAAAPHSGSAAVKQAKAAAVTGHEEIHVLADTAWEIPAAFRNEIRLRYAASASFAGERYAQTPVLFGDATAEVPLSAGQLSVAYEQYALDRLNLVRAASGLPEAGLSADYSYKAQAGTVLLEALRESVWELPRPKSAGSSDYYTVHEPPLPDGMDAYFHLDALGGTKNSNLALQFTGEGGTAADLAASLTALFLPDTDTSNMPYLSHRRWALNPHMGLTGFGHTTGTSPLVYQPSGGEAQYFTGDYYAMYANDTSGTAPDYEAIAYPAGPAFPQQYFLNNCPWSLTLNPAYYENPNPDTVTITLTHGTDTYTLDKADDDLTVAQVMGIDHMGEYFHVSTENYGVANCISFRPSVPVGLYAPLTGDWEVTVTGLKEIGGADCTLNYTVSFFDAASAFEEVVINGTTVTVDDILTVTYDAAGGRGAPSAQRKYPGQDITLSAVIPIRTGYDFLGWQADAETAYQPGALFTADADTALTAQWAEKTYTVTYNSGLGTGEPEAQTKAYFDDAFKLRDTQPTREGYIFQGWHDFNSGADYQPGDAYTVNADLALNAVWLAKQYTVTFNGDGGTPVPASFTKTHDIPFTLPTAQPAKTGYTFTGWYLPDGTKVAGSYTYEGDTTLTARWSINSYTLTVSGGGGSGTYTYGQSVTITANPPATGKLFDKWTGAAVANASASSTTLVIPAANTTVTATYKDDPLYLAVTAAAAALTENTIRANNSSLANATGNLTLPTSGAEGTAVSWSSSNPGTVAANGTVTRPAVHGSPVTVTLTATISKGGVTVTRQFTVVVQPLDCVNIHLWGKHTKYESNFINWLLVIICFGWIWMAF
ncbi:MAG: InlB B-repeat-containing protein [Oscillospiraceae bacterium]|jgi:uncharacterized repeat protein (TIGR02543 family)|nr:InlB B-repeat-containing protein [Oscillospiraceae bacterium]